MRSIGENLDFAALEQAVLVSEAGSIRKAAEILGTEPSAVSRRIRALEETIGVSLFHRQTHGVQPTQAGQQLLRRIKQVVDEGRQIVRAGRVAGEGREGALCIGFVASIAGGGARDLLRTFLCEHPWIDFSVVEGSPHDNIGEVEAIRIDAVVAVGHPPAPGCVTETLWSEPVMVAVPEASALASNYRISWAALTGARFLVSRTDPGPEIQDYIVQHTATLGHHPTIEALTVSRDGLLALVGLGRGVTLVSGAEADVRYPGVIFRHLDADRLPFSLIWAERNDNPILRRFMSHARRWANSRAQTGESVAAAQTPDPSP